MKIVGWKILVWMAACGLIPLGQQRARGAEPNVFLEGFDTEKISWTVQRDSDRIRILSHRRNSHIYVRGRAAENVEFVASQNTAPVVLEHALPPARVIDELTLSLWMRANREGAVLRLRAVFPHQKDPRTGAILTMLIRGDTYTKSGKWQLLKCTTVSKQIRRQLPLLRARLHNSNIDTREVYIDRVSLSVQPADGTTELFLDELRFAPVIPPSRGTTIVRTQAETARSSPPVDFRLDQLKVEDRSFFPRMVPYHSEDLSGLRETGVNVVWLRQYDDAGLLARLREHGLWAMATPPRAEDPAGEVLNSRDASLLPFSDETAPILFWYAGTRISSRSRDKLIAWNRQVRAADRIFRRPIMADVTGSERIFSRHVSMLGSSRHMLHTTFSFKQYRNWLQRKRKLSRPGSFVWTWIPTEASSVNANRRRSAGRIPIVVEPEQIRLQVYAALAAGCRGIGYWNTSSLDERQPGAFERRLAISQLNLELELLEPFLARGTLQGQIRFSANRGRPTPITQRNIGFRNSATERRERDDLLKQRDDQLKRDAEVGGELEAAIIQDHRALLVLPVWYQENAQFVPGRLAANDVTLVVPGVNRSSAAWEVTTTGIRSLKWKRDTGGIRVSLKKFDQTAAIIFTSDTRLIAELRVKIARIAKQSARLCIDLAKAKLQRVKQVDAELKSLGFGQLDAPQLLGKAALKIGEAEAAFVKANYDVARRSSFDAMQSMRILQRAHWNDAVRRLSSPVSSPHTVCFQTLPDHYRLIAKIGRSSFSADSDLLKSGDFENPHAMVSNGWRHTQAETPGVSAQAELYPQARRGNYSLRLIAVAKLDEEPPTVITRSPVTVMTPQLPVRAGQIIHIDGWIRVLSAPSGSLDGAMIYDSLGGPARAIRWNKQGGWQRFELIREAPRDGMLTVTIALNGLGEIQVDDLRVIPMTVKQLNQPTDATKPPDELGFWSRPLELWNRLPGLGPRRVSN